MQEWTIGAIDTLEDAMKTVGEVFYNLGEDIANSPAGQKIKIFVTGFVEEMSKAGEHLYKSTEKIINKIKTDGLHVVLADGIRHFGDAAAHFITETLVNEVGGEMSKLITIPLTTVMKALGMEEQGQAMRDWMDGALKTVANHLDGALDNHFDLLATLVEDPGEFVEMIEQEPWRLPELMGMIVPFGGVNTVIHQARFTFAWEQIEEFFEFDQDLKIPSGWLSDL